MIDSHSVFLISAGFVSVVGLIVLIAVVIASIWYFSRPVLFVIAILYMASGVLWRLQWIFRRKAPPAPPAYREASHTP